eukprot:TRINITY_DN11641_c0_g1_i1.p1 TRINITY_DN11641_c0_g1~~TRINITY_DN11641_c0_g1_i1.p1  ORF type:complete len:370 (+),score=72.80 TRINITY_DN11641_c0_g1_i1:147-1256(+)
MVAQMSDDETMDKRFAGHKQDVHCMGLCNNMLATGSRDTTARLYRLESGRCIRSLGSGVARGGLESVKGRTAPPVLGNKNPENGGHSSDVNAVCFVEGGKVLLTGGECLGSGDFLKAWDVESGRLIKNLEGHTEGVWAIACSHERRLVFSASSDRTVRVWSTESLECIQIIENHTDKVRALWWDERSDRLISGGHDNRVIVWNPEDWSVQLELAGHRDWVTSVWSNQEMIVSTSTDKTCKIWDLETGTCVQTLTHETWVVSSCMFQDLLIVALGDAKIAVYGSNSNSWELLWIVEAHQEHNAVSAVLQAGEDLLLSCSGDGTIKEWCRESLEQQAGRVTVAPTKVLEIEQASQESLLDGDIFGDDDVTA